MIEIKIIYGFYVSFELMVNIDKCKRINISKKLIISVFLNVYNTVKKIIVNLTATRTKKTKPRNNAPIQ